MPMQERPGLQSSNSDRRWTTLDPNKTVLVVFGTDTAKRSIVLRVCTVFHLLRARISQVIVNK